MEKLLLSILMIMKVGICVGQSDTVFIRYDKDQFDEKLKYEIDTIINKAPLIGTTILPLTINQIIAEEYEIYIKSVKITECGDVGEPENEEILDIIETDSTLIIETKIVGNCCQDFLCDVQILEELKINLIQYHYGNNYCACSCCYGLTYEFSIMKEDDRYKKLEYVLLNGNEKTIKRK